MLCNQPAISFDVIFNGLTFFLILSLNPCTRGSCLAMYPRTPACIKVAASFFVRRRCNGSGGCGLSERFRVNFPVDRGLDDKTTLDAMNL